MYKFWILWIDLKFSSMFFILIVLQIHIKRQFHNLHYASRHWSSSLFYMHSYFDVVQLIWDASIFQICHIFFNDRATVKKIKYLQMTIKHYFNFSKLSSCCFPWTKCSEIAQNKHFILIECVHLLKFLNVSVQSISAKQRNRCKSTKYIC